MSSTQPAGDSGISILDIIVLIAESWILIVSSAIAGAMLGLAFAYVQPAAYQTTVDTSLPFSQAQRLLIANKSPFDTVAADEIRFVETGTKGTRVFVTGNNVESINGTLSEVVSAFRAEYQLEKAKLQSDLNISRMRLEELDRHRQQLRIAASQIEEIQPIDGAAFAAVIHASYALLDRRNSLERDIANLERQLTEVWQEFTEHSSSAAEPIPNNSPMKFSIFFGFSSALLAISFVFVRFGIYNTNISSEDSEKISRIRRALLLRKRQAN